MRYDWEDDAIETVTEKLDMTSEYKIIGVAVANTETGKACFCECGHRFDGIERADYMSDVLVDAEEAYKESVKCIHDREGRKK